MMSNLTKIEWTERTWNPVVGCSLASPGCTNCYAMRMAYRLSKNPQTPQYHGTAELVNGKPVFTGKLALVEKALLEPLKRKTPTVYFVNSMSDLFHKDIPDEWIDRIFAVMALCPQHTFQILTKRADRMREYIEQARMDEMNGHAGTMMDWSQMPDDAYWPLPNVWLGVSVEDQRRAEERIPELLATPAAIRFISAEPLLGPVDLALPQFGATYCAQHCTKDCMARGDEECPKYYGKIDQVIVGGESGPNARPMHPDWARSLRDQCKAAGTAFFFKQWGEWLPVCQMKSDTLEALYHPAPEDYPDAHQRCKFDNICFDADGTKHPTGKAGQFHTIPDGAFAGVKPVSIFKVGKKAAGRKLDRQEWNEVPA